MFFTKSRKETGSMPIHSDYNIELGARIRSVRESLHMTREQFSEKCDISDSFLADVERGKKSITVKTLKKLCYATNVSADYFVLGRNEDFATDTILEILYSIPTDKRKNAMVILREYAKALKDC